MDKIVLAGRAHDPWIVLVPGEVADTVGVTAVHEEHFRWTILGILGGLLSSTPGNIPEDDAAVVRRRCDDGRVSWVPLDLGDGVLMALHAVDLAMLGEAQVEDTDGLVSRTRAEELIVLGMEGQRVDSIGVGVFGFFAKENGCTARVLRANVHEAHGEVVRDTAKEILSVLGMPLDVVDVGRVLGEDLCRRDGGILFGVIALQIPQTHGLVLAARNELALGEGIPLNCKSLPGVRM